MTGRRRIRGPRPGWWCPGVSVMFRWCLGSRSCFRGVSVAFRWCLGHVLVVSGSCFGVLLMFGWCAGCVFVVFLFCFAVLVMYRFCGGGSLIFWWCLAHSVVVPRSQSWCMYELCACVPIHLVHNARWRLSAMSRLNVQIMRRRIHV